LESPVVARERRAWFALGACVAVAVCLRLALVHAGPDTESDAYAHHVLARRVILEPSNPQVHWVWLPLFHWLSALAITAGGTMDTLRIANALAVAVPAFVVARQLRDVLASHAARPSDAWVPWVAGALVAWHPWVTTIGATAQNEPLFLTLLSLFSLALSRGARGVASLVLMALVLLRYEAWAVLLGLVIVFLSPWRTRLFGPRPLVGALVTMLPGALAIAAWSYVRMRSGEAPFAYLRDTHQFVQDARHDHLTLVEALRKLPYYPVQLPYWSFGIPAIFAAVGVLPMVRVLGPAFVVPYAACLAFVTATWMSGGQLGLLRHFVSSVPLFAAAIAFGLAEVSRRLTHRHAAKGLVIVSLAIEALHLRGSFLYEQRVVASAWPDRRAVVDAVKALPASAHVVCDEPTIELLSDLPLRTTKRWWATDPLFETWVRDYAKEGPVWLAIVRDRLRNRDAFGEPLVTSRDGRYALFRVEAVR